MDHPAFSPDTRRLLDAIASRGGRVQVAFDADGTLWHGDVGEELLHALELSDLLPKHRGRRGMFAEYERRLDRDPKDAFRYAASLLAGWEEGALLSHCEAFFKERFEARVFPYVRPLLALLNAHGCEVYVVSASPLWPVIAGAATLGIPRSRVLAVTCAVEGGLLTERVLDPVPCAEGKVAALQSREVRPFIAAGNSRFDLAMLSYAKHAMWVAPHDEEGSLTRAAAERGWAVQRG